MTEQNQDISQQLLNTPINDDKFWEIKQSNVDDIQNQEQQQENIVDDPLINQENQEENLKKIPGFWNQCIFQCIGDCLVAVCLEIFVRGLC